ncbi:GGDEF domain-containing protein [Aliikangiella sp. IMCC44653]
MNINRKLNLVTTSALVMLVLICLSVGLAWQKVDSALARVEYSRAVGNLVYRLQNALLFELNPQLRNSHAYQWEKGIKALTAKLSEAPTFPGEIQSIQNSLLAKSRSLDALYLYIAEIKPTADRQEIKSHLRKRMLQQIESVREDSQRLVLNAEKSIREIIIQQLFLVGSGVLIFFVVFFFNLYRFVDWFKTAIEHLNKGLRSVRQGNFQPVDTNQEFGFLEPIMYEFNRMSEQLRDTTVSHDAMQQIVAERTESLKQIAITDYLTQIPNRRALFEQGSLEYTRARRHNFGLSLLIIDCDHFKKINDVYGHLTGDKVLIHLTRLTTQAIRDIDLLGRFGGEEFIVILPHSGQQAAIEIARRIQKNLSEKPFEYNFKPIALTVSIGIACLTQSTQSLEELISCADKALLTAKSSGRNTFVVAE